MKNFVFYDFETSGISSKFDQALQFAAILTDQNLVPISEVNIRCKLSDHILPSPIALAITGLRPVDLSSPEMSYYDFSIKLANIIDDWSPAIWAGYNSIAFDESFFRQIFYQNLHPDIYKTQRNGNVRFDILRAVYACWGLGKDTIKIPIVNGKSTSKLDTLAPENGFKDHHAHDALGDVKGTIYVAELIKNNEPDLWSALIGNIDKTSILSAIKSGEIFNLIERWGAQPPKVYTGVYLGHNHNNKNQFGYLDLNAKKAGEVVNGDYSIIKKAIEGSPKVIRTIDLNKMPLLFQASDVSEEESMLAQRVTANNELQDISSKVLSEKTFDPDDTGLVENKIYDNFYDNQDKYLLEKFKKSDWQTRSKVVNELTDERLVELGRRLVILNSPQYATNEEVTEFWQMIFDRWSGDIFYGENIKKPGNTHKSVIEDLSDVGPGKKFETTHEILEEYRMFFEMKLNESVT